MPLKLGENISCMYTEKQKENDSNRRTKNFSKVEALYLALMCFATHCLSCVTLEVGNRSPIGNPVTKSAAFNALFRRTYNLKIIILVTNVITGLITTIMITLADKYGVPYLYLPWLMSTMTGMAVYEGPALYNLANELLPNVTFPTATFVLTTLFLYVEELCIWNNIFIKFQHCWESYHNERQSTIDNTEKKLFIIRNRRLHYLDNVESKLNIGVEQLKSAQNPIEFCSCTNDRICTDSRLRPVKSTIDDNNNFIRNQSLHMTG